MAQKFYKLTEEEFLEINQKLKDSELRIYLYLAVKLPFADSAIEVDTSAIAEVLGLSRRSIQRAMKRLDELKLLDVEITKARIRRHQDRQATAVSPERQQCRQNDSSVARTTAVSPERQQCRQRELEPSLGKDSKPLQTYIDFKKTLSEEEGVAFEQFCFRRIDESSMKIASRISWLNKHWEEYWADYRKAYPEQESSAAVLWTNEQQQQIDDAIASGQIQIKRDYVGGKFCDTVIDRDRGWFRSVEDWLNG